MRVDETGAPCPATLGEYRDLCRALGGEDCAAVKLLDIHIARSKIGRDDVVVAPDSQMRMLLMPLLITKELPFVEESPPSDDRAPKLTAAQEAGLEDALASMRRGEGIPATEARAKVRALVAERRGGANVLRMWTVYHSPRDFPGKYVARLRLIRSGQPDEVTSQVFVADTLEQVRALLPPGLHCLARYPEDEPAIVEVWF